MHLKTCSWQEGGFIPEQFAAGKWGEHGIEFSKNDNPHFIWQDVPPETRSFVLISVDPTAPSSAAEANLPDREIRADLARTAFYHWVLVDLPPVLREIQAGEFSDRFIVHGKTGPETLHGARQGLNDYTKWFAQDQQFAGQYFGYDGPFPPFNDALIHRYIFTLYALSIDKCPVTGVFEGPQVLAAIQPYVLAQASVSGLYSLNQRLLNRAD